MSVRLRFAPSPTGYLHVGNVRTALVNWLYARQQQGQFILRLDDTDPERSSAHYTDAIRDDLTWLGLDWDETFKQSGRLARYAEAAEQLKAAGRLYPCYETSEELSLKRKVLLSRHKPPVYDRAALALTDADRAKLEAEGRKPHWRFRLKHRTVTWDDGVRGPQHYDLSALSDPILIREDGSLLYTLPSVVDDMDTGITHVFRGEDHVTNTAAQIDLFEALGGKPPSFAHFALIAGSEGEGLSKREGALAIQHLREDGFEPLAILSLLGRIGTSDAIAPAAHMDELVDGFDLSKFGRATAKFDLAELETLNGKLLHLLDYQQVADRVPGLTPDFWQAVRPNLTRLSDVADWRDVVDGPLAPVIEDADFLSRALDVLPPEPWDDTTWGSWTGTVKQVTGRKGKELFLPLRLAITGRSHGPEMKLLLPLIPRARVMARLAGETA